MPLPKIATPTYELELPSTGQNISYRPFLVKEEKVLLQALETSDDVEIKNAIKDIVSTCTFGQVNAGNLPTFDLEYIFLQIRAKSVGETAKIRLLCPDDKETYVNHDIDLTKVEVQVDEGHTNKIELTKDTGLIMTYPTFKTMDSLGDTKLKSENMLDVISSCILQIYENKGEKVYEAKDQTKAELIEFLEQLNSTQFTEVRKFFDTMPKLKHDVKVKNPKTKKESKITLTGLNDFFA